MLPTQSIKHHFQTKHFSKETLLFLNSPTMVMLSRHKEPQGAHWHLLWTSRSGSSTAPAEPFQGNWRVFWWAICILLTLHQGTAVWDMRSAAHKMTSLYFFLYLPLCLRKSTTDLLSRKQAEAPLGKRLKKRYQLQPSSCQVSAEAVHSIN